MEKKTVAALMSKELGVEVDENLVVMLPDDGCPGHMGSTHWNVYAARAGEFTMLAYVYADGSINIRIV
jgi:hypothetical protein